MSTVCWQCCWALMAMYLHNTAPLVTLADTWWRHQMEAFSALLALCAGNSPSPVNSQQKDQWRGALMFSLICAWINGWINNCKAVDVRCHSAHYDVTVMRPAMNYGHGYIIATIWNYAVSILCTCSVFEKSRFYCLKFCRVQHNQWLPFPMCPVRLYTRSLRLMNMSYLSNQRRNGDIFGTQHNLIVWRAVNESHLIGIWYPPKTGCLLYTILPINRYRFRCLG